jgi:hypothetical protein
LNINIDRDMLLIELYAIRAKIADAAAEHDEAAEAKQKIDNLIQLISVAPESGNNSNFPKPRLRR